MKNIEKLTMLLVMTMLARPGTPMVISQGSDAGPRRPSVHYILSKQGNFFVAPGKALKEEDAAFTLPAKNACQCKSMCFVTLECVAWSLVSLDDGTAECRIAAAGPTTYEVLEHANATYYFKEESVRGEYSFKKDNLLYLTPPFTRTYDVAKSFCSRIPGHRLGVYKTLQQLSILDPYRYAPTVPDTLYISVEKGPSGIVLGDGTLLADTALGQAVEIVTDNDDSLNVYVFYQGKLNDGDGSRSRFFMCQANPLAVEW
ncbi:uncharacterized protein [Penaeus vannamei]|uniref:uncharacterized protein n=1 Tax=Penaeus vannamei TaxID=6689 RepID=UPI000F682D48|nr:uncharacterized protein LOC113801227 [Penaeus vannamei]